MRTFTRSAVTTADEYGEAAAGATSTFDATCLIAPTPGETAKRLPLGIASEAKYMAYADAELLPPSSTSGGDTVEYRGEMFQVLWVGAWDGTQGCCEAALGRVRP